MVVCGGGGGVMDLTTFGQKLFLSLLVFAMSDLYLFPEASGQERGCPSDGSLTIPLAFRWSLPIYVSLAGGG